MEKKRIFPIIGLLCILWLAVPGYVKAEEVKSLQNFVMPTGDMAVRKPSRPMELLSSADADNLNAKMSEYEPQQTELLVNRAGTFYYYSNLDPIAKEIYDVMYQVARDPGTQGNIGLMMTDMDPQSDEYYYEFNLAYRAICFDHPELFWLYSGEEAEIVYLSEAVNQNGFYFVYVMMLEPFTGFAEQMTAFNSAADAFLADIDTGISEYSTICQIHDKLLDLVNYNDPVAAGLFYSARGQDLAHTAYGALVTDSAGNSNYAVCDGYSLAFEYLLQQCGIEAVFLGGMAGASETDSGAHAWNMVKMDGSWYEVDCTWDDSGSMADDIEPGTEEYQYVIEALSDPVYRETIDHALFLVSTDQMTHFVPGPEYEYVTKDQSRVYQLVQESVHIRLIDENSVNEYDPAVIALAPVSTASYR